MSLRVTFTKVCLPVFARNVLDAFAAMLIPKKTINTR